MTAPRLEPLAPADAIAAFEARGRRLVGTEHWTELWQREHANAFTVARSAGFDILGDVHKAVLDVLAEGQTFRTFASELQPVLETKGWWGRAEDGAQLGSMRRLKTIFDANLRVSYAAGAWAQFERNKANRPWLRYVSLVYGENRRPEHVRRHNLCLHVDDPYWDTWAPPCGWGCQCTLQALSDRDVDRMRGELKFTPPPDEGTQTFVRTATGETFEVPIGIDPGWAHNPGKAGHQAVLQADKLIGAPPELAAARVTTPDWPARPLADEFGSWVDDILASRRVQRSTFTVGAITPPQLAGLRAAGVNPASAAITARQDLPGHVTREAKSAAPPLDVLRRLPEILAQAKALLLDREGRLVLVFDPPAGEDRAGKIALHVDYAERASAPGQRVAIVSNSIRSLGLVETHHLRDTNQYQLIWGSV